jgi:hypothetical protein
MFGGCPSVSKNHDQTSGHEVRCGGARVAVADHAQFGSVEGHSLYETERFWTDAAERSGAMTTFSIDPVVADAEEGKKVSISAAATQTAQRLPLSLTTPGSEVHGRL